MGSSLFLDRTRVFGMKPAICFLVIIFFWHCVVEAYEFLYMGGLYPI